MCSERSITTPANQPFGINPALNRKKSSGINGLDADFDNNVSLGRLADWLSEVSRQGIEYPDIAFMCLLTRALFEGDFDSLPQTRFPFEQLVPVPVVPRTVQVPNFIWYPEQPETGSDVPDAFLGWRDGDRLDVVVLLQQFDSVPREAAGFPETVANDAVLEILASIPYLHFPVTAQALIDNVRIARPKLRLWLAERGLEMPAGLVVEGDTGAPESGVPEALQTQNDNTPSRGRPSKKAWAMIIEYAKRMHSDNPARLKQCVANDVYEIALNAFGPDEVPAPATIQRRMKDILGG